MNGVFTQSGVSKGLGMTLRHRLFAGGERWGGDRNQRDQGLFDRERVITVTIEPCGCLVQRPEQQTPSVLPFSLLCWRFFSCRFMVTPNWGRPKFQRNALVFTVAAPRWGRRRRSSVRLRYSSSFFTSLSNRYFFHTKLSVSDLFALRPLPKTAIRHCASPNSSSHAITGGFIGSSGVCVFRW